MEKKQLAIIHIAKKQLGMSDEDYQAMLSGYGVQHASELDPKGFRSIMLHFEKMGFVGKNHKPGPHRMSSRRLQADKIRAIAHEMHLTTSYLDAISRNMFGIDCWHWLDAHQMAKLMIALVYHQKRNERKANIA